MLHRYFYTFCVLRTNILRLLTLSTFTPSQMTTRYTSSYYGGGGGGLRVETLNVTQVPLYILCTENKYLKAVNTIHFHS